MREIPINFMNQNAFGHAKKLLVVCGPTATGKTALALFLAKKFDAEILSADSRQVYKKMDIGTGKELPEKVLFKDMGLKFDKRQIGYYDIGGVRVWGYDLVDPREKFSVGQYTRIAEKILEDIRERKKLPIVVGGTGFYIKSLVSEIETLRIPQNKPLRKALGEKSTSELFEILAQTDPIKAGSLNTSDSRNPRRLVRAIEVAYWRVRVRKAKKPVESKNFDTLFIGLYATKKFLEERIRKRIQQRLKKGIEKEIGKLLKYGVRWKDQSMDSIAYSEWDEYFSGNKTKEDVLEKWEKDEKNYAKRQMTWFKRDPNIHWFDISEKDFVKDVEKLIKEWYISSNKTTQVD